MHKRWTAEDDAECRALYASRTMTVEQLAEKYGRTPTAITNHCAGARRSEQWTDYKTSQLAALAQQGLSTEAIAERLGVTKNAVIGRCYRMDIPLGHSGGAPIAQRRRRGRSKESRKLEQAKARTAEARKAVEALAALPAPRPVENPSPTPVRVKVPERKLVGRDVRYLSKLAASLVQARADQCRFPLGDAICQEPATEGSSWCKKHIVLCFSK